jgi:hypothetical protein
MQYQKQKLGRDLHNLEDRYYNQDGIRTKPSLLDQPEIHLCTYLYIMSFRKTCRCL